MICYHTTRGRRHPARRVPGRHWLVRLQHLGVHRGMARRPPVDINEGAKGDQVFRVEFPDDVDLSEYEIIEDQSPYREWCVHAALINTRGALTRATTNWSAWGRRSGAVTSTHPVAGHRDHEGRESNPLQICG